MSNREIGLFFFYFQYILRSTLLHRALYYGKIETQTSYLCMYATRVDEDDKAPSSRYSLLFLDRNVLARNT